MMIKIKKYIKAVKLEESPNGISLGDQPTEEQVFDTAMEISLRSDLIHLRVFKAIILEEDGDSKPVHYKYVPGSIPVKCEEGDEGAKPMGITYIRSYFIAVYLQ
jgi:hypothetical protein